MFSYITRAICLALINKSIALIERRVASSFLPHTNRMMMNPNIGSSASSGEHTKQ